MRALDAMILVVLILGAASAVVLCLAAVAVLIELARLIASVGR